ncbi:hypothetical protein MNBD_GAMMA22-2223 [hydrothermal vent metagenome]|uniref:Uncharacterized protein n=1 Tax=hydrothermal vent metagenome TaxID=652676 RepID=A0A3B1AWF6_9ZZZZ
MKQSFFIVAIVLNTTVLASVSNTANAVQFSVPSTVAENKLAGNITLINYNKRNISINGIAYKLSNTVKVYGFKGDKYINVKKLSPKMKVEFKFSRSKGKNTVTEIWVQAL